MMRNRPQLQAARPNQTLLQTTKTVFVANIPFDVTEEQLTSIFSEVGPVQEFVLKFDQNTGKAKGFGFCHYFDHETALSAVRNLQEVVVNGRNLRVELSTDEPYKPRGAPGNAPNARGGRPGPGDGFGGPPGMGDMGFQPRMMGAPQGQFGGGPGGGFTPPPQGMRGPQGMPSVPPPAGGFGGGGQGGVNLGMLPPGQDVPIGQKATDVISKTLASIPPGKLEEVLTGMKTLVQTSPDQARAVLNAHPQLAYALFQAMLLMNVVDPAVLSRIQPIPNTSVPPQPPQHQQPAFRPPPPGYQQQQQQQQQQPFQPPTPVNLAPTGPPTMPPFAPTALPVRPPAQTYTGTPPHPHPQTAPPFVPPQPPAPPVPPAAAQPPAAQTGGGGPNQAAMTAALSMVSEDQRQMLMQVFQLTPAQINALPPDQRVGVLQLRSQFGIN